MLFYTAVTKKKLFFILRPIKDTLDDANKYLKA